MYLRRRQTPLENGKRIWELDALRGICILGMVIIHFVYDLVDLYGIIQWNYPPCFIILRDWGGVVFILISGICATFSRRSARRGIIVLGCGLAITAVTAGMYLLGLSDESIIISFGILHCLGCCMLLWPAFRRLPLWELGILGTAMVGLGWWFRTFTVASSRLFWLGLASAGFISADFFPLLPNFGYFLLGALLGKTLYRDKKPLLSRRDGPVLRFFQCCGKHSLVIYLLHQPVLMGCIELFLLL